ncbi:MAG TPA: carbohydrate binding domain-containing protein [Abditibacteriaceae bacterium]
MVLCVFLSVGVCRAQAPSPAVRSNPAVPLFSFALPPFDGTETPTDVSFLNEKPAGARGFIAARGEHFVDGIGRPIRFWGVNLNFGGVFPSKEEAPLIARRLAKFGFNAVRLHHYEGNAAPNGIWKASALGSSRLAFPREVDADVLDRMDFFLSELIKNGIYINLNLHVARKTTEADGVPNAAQYAEKDKGASYFDAKLIALQNDFSRAMLTHVNPYTTRALKDEPGVCAVEIVNENSLLGIWLDGDWKAPAAVSEQLRTRWNLWLRERYDENSLRAAWTEVNDPIDYRNLFDYPLPISVLNPNAPDSRPLVGLESLRRLKLATVTGANGTISVDENGGPTIDGWVRPGATVSLDRVGTASWAFQVNRDGLDLVEGQPYTLSFWARADAPRRISVNLWQDRQPNRSGGFTGYADLTNDWQQFTFVFRPSNPDPAHSRISWNLGNATGAVGIGEIALNAGGRIAAPDEWSLGRGIPLIDFKSTQVVNARRDYAEFLGSIEAEYGRNQRQFLRALGVRVPLWISQAQFGSWGGLAREIDSDAIDVHAYWKHPSFGGGGWSGTNWTVGNESMTRAPGIDPLSAFSFVRAPGKPFVMTEWNSGQPNDFGAESLLMAASYAAWQDWAAVYVFDYHSSGVYNRDRFEGFFSIDSHPAKMISAPAAALLFRRPPTTSFGGNLGDVKEAQESVTLTIPRSQTWLETANIGDGTTAAPFVKTWRDAGAYRGAPLRGKVYSRFAAGVFPTTTRAEVSTSKRFQSDTREIEWDGNAGTYLVSTPRTKVVAGFWGGKTVDAEELQITMTQSASNYAVFSLSSLDGADIATSKSLLLTAAGRVENIGMTWNAERTSVGNGWGSGPTQVEGIAARIQLIAGTKNVRVWALNASGNPRSAVPVVIRNGVLSFEIQPSYKTLWYQIESA